MPRILKPILLAVLFLATLHAQTIPTVLLSDLHFDPLRDPAKAPQLVAAPIAAWPAILDAPATPTQPADFVAMQKKCGSPGRGIDADYPLLLSGLTSAAAHNPHFVTVSGDLLVHSFECRYKLATGHDTGFAEFAEKTTNFVITQVESAFPRVPVYIGLGNNDSSCGDYQLDSHDRYLRATSAAILAGLRGISPAERRQAATDYESTGSYAVTLPGLHRTRLLVLNDMFLSRKYKTCAGKPDEAAAAAPLTWLRLQLASAKAHHTPVWVMGHIPPGVDVYSTVKQNRDVCGGKEPEIFLADDSLTRLLTAYPETIRLGLFGHTHSDEIRLLGSIPIKLVASITPINGNHPSYTVAQVQPATATLADYTLYVASDMAGAAPWAKAYSYDETYHAQDFTAASLDREITAFRQDPKSVNPTSQAYEQAFYPGSPSPLALVWPQYTCALKDPTAASYRTCICTLPKPTP